MSKDFQILMQCWCASLSVQARNLIAVEIGLRSGYDCKFPLPENLVDEIILNFDTQFPHFYQWAKVNPLPGGWICSAKDLRDRLSFSGVQIQCTDANAQIS